MKWILSLLFTSAAWATPDMELSKKHLDFYAHHLSLAKSEILGVEDCHIKAEAKIENVTLSIEAGNKLFYSGDFDLGVDCLKGDKRIKLKGVLMLEKTESFTTVKTMTFSFKETRRDYEYLLAELGYFSLDDILNFKRD